MKRACGILLPVSSLPGHYGIGCFSSRAYEFVDRLKKAGQSYWQILPLGPTGFGDSPYQAFSSFAGNPYFIDLDELVKQGYLNADELAKTDWGSDEASVDYGKIWQNRWPALKKAFLAFRAKGNPEQFEEDRKSLDPETREFCLYQAIKDSEGGKPWQEWEDSVRLRKPEALEKARDAFKEEIAFYEWIQTEFNRQWTRLKKYANAAGIEIIGDMPFYVAPDSACAWAHPELFQFNEDRKPVRVAGCPPDYFSPDGQFWGNPVYDWEYHRKTGYAWWISRIKYALSLYDYVRVDHFRGFDEYYAIPAENKNARNGKWEKGPGMEIFREMQDQLSSKYSTLPIIAEDLGLMTESVLKLVRDSGFPAMKVLEFAYDSDNRNLYLPHNYIRNCVAYTGTHDNQPLMGWICGMNKDTRLHMIRYQGGEHTPENDLYWDCIRTVLSSIADTAIIPMPDYLGLGDEGRINTPSSVKGNNWKWRMKENAFSDDLICHCDMLSGLYGRK